MTDARRWTIARVMVTIASLAPLMALARSPYPFGFLLGVGLIALPVAHSIWRRHYGRIALVMCAYPALPLLMIYLDWWLRRQKVPRKPWREMLDGAIGISDIGAYLCLLAYVGCVSIVAGGSAKLGRGSTLKRAAWRVVLIMPFAWAAFVAFALWDPLGMLASIFR